jgi:Uma2 family endonuclease
MLCRSAAVDLLSISPDGTLGKRGDENMPVSESTYERVALEDDEGRWELVCGDLRQKPPMTLEHGQAARKLARRLILQLPEEQYTVGQESPRLRVPDGNFRIPDVCVVPTSLIEERFRRQPARLEVYEQPMPLVVEIWSPSTGGYDVETKLLEYQQRGDLEIWRIHPYERTLIAWRRLPNGTYAETLYSGGVIEPAFLLSVRIELESLFM